MPATISAGAYDNTDHTVTLTVTGGDPGELTVYRDFVTGDRVVQLVGTDPDYDGTSQVFIDRFAFDGTNTYYAYIDGVQQDSDPASVAMVDDWLVSLTDADHSIKPCVIRENELRRRVRRGWFGDVVGSGRTVSVTDVGMSGLSGNLSLLARNASERYAATRLLTEGVVSARSTRDRMPVAHMLILDYDVYPIDGQETPHWRIDFNWSITWPVGMRVVLPDEPDPEL